MNVQRYEVEGNSYAHPAGAWVEYHTVTALESEVARLQQVIRHANNSLYGTDGFFLSLNGGDPNPRHLSDGIENLKAISGERYMDVARLREAALKAIACADKDVGIAKLSDDDLHWLCPRCNAPGSCKPGCTRNALLGALDELSTALAPAAQKDGDRG